MGVAKAAGIAGVPGLLIIVSGVTLGVVLLRRVTPAELADQPRSGLPV
jgi:hypothetical protein